MKPSILFLALVVSPVVFADTPCHGKRFAEVRVEKGQKILVCEKNAFLLFEGKKKSQVPVLVQWNDGTRKEKIRPAFQKFKTSVQDSHSFLLNSDGSYGDAMSCTQMLTVFQERLLLGPGFCLAGEGVVQEIKFKDKSSPAEVIVEQMEQDLSGFEIKTKKHTIETWTWQSSQWQKTFEKVTE